MISHMTITMFTKHDKDITIVICYREKNIKSSRIDNIIIL